MFTSFSWSTIAQFLRPSAETCPKMAPFGPGVAGFAVGWEGSWTGRFVFKDEAMASMVAAYFGLFNLRLEQKYKF